jgi:8-oxo-dGTP diphosphatase
MPAPVTPPVACDAIVELADYPGRPIVLIQRRNPPFGWAIPGGFMDLGETTEQAVVREAREEISLDIALVSLLGVYSESSRDPRGQTVSVVYVAEARGTPRASDDARALDVFLPERIPDVLAFDHATILEDYRNWRATGRLPRPRT